MKNLEQIRAQSALMLAKESEAGNTPVSGANGGEAIKKIPPMIMANGLLATIAFSLDGKRDGYAAILSHLARHLCSPGIEVTKDTNDAKSLIEYLVAKDSATLRLATAESLEWFGYARRFVKKQGGEK